MRTRELKIYVKVCEEMSFTKAAQKLYLAQPSVSRTITKLEHEYEEKFFHRLGKNIQLTDSGETFLVFAKKMLELEAELEDELKSYGKRIKIRLGSSITIGTYLLPKVVKEIQEKMSGIKIEVVIDNSQKIMERIRENTIDLALVERLEDQSLLKVERIMTDKMVLVASKDNAIADQVHEKLSDIEGEKFMLREKGSASRDIMEAMMQKAQLQLNLGWESISNEALVKAVEENIGVTALSQYIVEEQLRKGTLKEIIIKEVNMERHFYLVHHENKILSPQMLKLIELMIKAMREVLENRDDKEVEK